MAKDCFCLDASSLNEEQQKKFAKSVKTTVDDFNEKLDQEEIEKEKGENESE